MRPIVSAIAAMSVAALAAGSPQSGAISGPVEGNGFTIGNVRVVNGAQATAGATVVVRNGRIEAIGAAVSPPKDLPFVDGTGKTLIPGLIDSHTHRTTDEGRADALRFGVTTELNMSESLGSAQSRRNARDRMERTRFADVWSSGTPATSPGGLGTTFGYPVPTLSSPEEAGEFVRTRLAEGADYLKIIYEAGNGAFTSISKDTLEALVKAAHARGKLAVVHISTRTAARDAVEAGADGLMHLFITEPADDALIAAIVAKKIFVTATLSVGYIVRTSERPWTELLESGRVAPYLSVAQRSSLQVSEEQLAVRRQGRAQSDAFPGNAHSSLSRLAALGADILAGTDVGVPGLAHGASLHGELAQLVRSGLTPAQALRSATTLPAKRLGLTDRGDIRPGLRADLVLIDGDPTTDITATREIARVFKNGYQIDRSLTPGAPSTTGRP
jgi:imidazolonepropionase-like amidohydrolase